MTNLLETRLMQIIRQEIVKQTDIECLKVLIDEEIENTENEQFTSDFNSFFRTLDYKLKRAIEKAAETDDVIDVIKQEAVAYEILDIGCCYDLSWDSDVDQCRDILIDFFMRRTEELGQYIRTENI